MEVRDVFEMRNEGRHEEAYTNLCIAQTRIYPFQSFSMFVKLERIGILKRRYCLVELFTFYISFLYFIKRNL